VFCGGNLIHKSSLLDNKKGIAVFLLAPPRLGMAGTGATPRRKKENNNA
jgi:hypothetical protein